MCKSAKLLFRHRIWASASEMGVVVESIGFGWYRSGGKFAGGPKSCSKARSYLKKKNFVHLLAGLGTLLPSVHQKESILL
jgi:hypothetical protein